MVDFALLTAVGAAKLSCRGERGCVSRTAVIHWLTRCLRKGEESCESCSKCFCLVLLRVFYSSFERFVFHQLLLKITLVIGNLLHKRQSAVQHIMHLSTSAVIHVSKNLTGSSLTCVLVRWSQWYLTCHPTSVRKGEK